MVVWRLGGVGGFSFRLVDAGLVERGVALRDALLEDEDDFEEEGQGTGHETDEISGDGVEHGTCIHGVTVVVKYSRSNKKVH